MGHTHLTDEQRRTVIIRLLTEPETLQKDIAEDVGCHQGTVSEYKTKLAEAFGDTIVPGGGPHRITKRGTRIAKAHEVLEQFMASTPSGIIATAALVEVLKGKYKMNVKEARAAAYGAIGDAVDAGRLEDVSRGVWKVTDFGTDSGDEEVLTPEGDIKLLTMNDLERMREEETANTAAHFNAGRQPVSEGDIVTIRFFDKGDRGDPMGKFDGFVVFCSEVDVGQRARVRIDRVEPTFAISHLLEVVS